MICSSMDDIVPSTTATRPAPHEPAAAIANPRDRDDASTHGEETCRRYELKLLNSTEDLLNSVRNSVVSNASVSDLKRDHHSAFMAAPAASTSSPSLSRRPKSRLETKLRLIARYIKTMSVGLSHKQRASHSAPASLAAHTTQSTRPQHGVLVMKRSQISLSQYSQPRSAPDMLAEQKSTRGSNAHAPRFSSSSHQTSLSWDEICSDAVLVEEDEIMPASPGSRKRGRRPHDLFDDGELQRICAQSHVPKENRDQVIAMIKTQFGTCQLDLTVLHSLINRNSAVLIGLLVFSCIDSAEELLDMNCLPAFLFEVQKRYNESNPFHNACHAADVLHSLFMMLWTTQLGQRVSLHNRIGVLFAAIMHDIEHVGFTNDFLMKTNHEIAVKYASRAPMEEMHLTVAIELLTDARFDVLIKMPRHLREDMLHVVRESIRSTALCYQKDLLRDIADVSAEEWDAAPVLPIKLQTVALRCAMHLSDIGQTMKPFAIHSTWVNRLNEEQFLQGDLDQHMQYAASPECYYRNKWKQDSFLSSQVWFLKNMALPAAKAFNSIPWLNALILEENLQANIVQWQSRLSSRGAETARSCSLAH